ncbi:hypothetical protein Baya_10103 [Bagarius yarrelli]|uniref:Uncharacterized protein n=1 Tax=Bagarius yarrelli TaxID=175774 RepID=A0A556UEY4_BAGYA|nr:hypothetical protein Baya_10103 [Bagarius yarrelli]
MMSRGREGGGCAMLGMSMALKTTTYLPSKFKTLIKKHERGYEEKSACESHQDCAWAPLCQWLLEAAVVPEADPHSLLPPPTTERDFHVPFGMWSSVKRVRPEQEKKAVAGMEEKEV